MQAIEHRSSKDRFIDSSFNIILLTPLLVSFFFFFIPLFFILIDAFLSDSGYITAEFIISTLVNPLNLYFIRFTINQAIISSIITIILGLPGAYIFAKYRFPGDRILKTILTIPFVLPPIVVVLGFILLIGPNGILNSVLMTVLRQESPPIKLYKTFEGIILVHAFYNIPIVLHLVSSAWKKANVDMEEVATTLGSRKLHFFRYVTFPQISSAILASSILTFLYCFTSFAVVLSLGGIQYKTLEVQIYSLFHYRYDYHQAAALALFQLLITSVLIILYLFFSEPVFKRERFTSFLPKSLRRTIQVLAIVAITSVLLYFRVNFVLILLLGLIGVGFWKFGHTTPLTIGEIRERSERKLGDVFSQDKKRFSMVIIYITSLTVFLLSPILVIFISAFYDRITNNWNIEAFFHLLGFRSNENGFIWAPESIPALGAATTAFNLIINSIIFALITVVLSTFFGVLSIYMIRRSDFLGRHPIMGLLLSWSLVLPLVTSSITIGLGMLRAFGFIRISSQDTWIPIILAHLIAAYPFVSRSVSTAYNKIDFNLIEMGKTVGASKWHIFRNIEFP
ncbi:MAG: ABC transporter permease, partial [Promethearchaeota archaeon]